LSEFGDAGAGWIGFGYPAAGYPSVNGNARFANFPVGFSGTWAANYNGASYSPDICAAQSSTTGSRITVGFPANTATIRLLYGATSDGSSAGTARYSFDDGTTWTNIILSGSNRGDIVFAGIPATPFTLIIEVVGTNNCRLAGLFATNTETKGVRVNKLGASGARAEQFANFQSASHRTGLSRLGGLSSMAVIMFGANDQGSSRTKAQFKADIKTIIDSYRNTETSPRFAAYDILLVAPPENNRPTNSIAMSEYQEAMLELARENNCGFINMQSFFGANPADYASNGMVPLMNADLLHPEPTTGGKLMAQVLIDNLIFN
jgi:hypothetical protein